MLVALKFLYEVLTVAFGILTYPGVFVGRALIEALEQNYESACRIGDDVYGYETE